MKPIPEIMSDTPRTDEHVESIGADGLADGSFARTLERENAAQAKEIAELKERLEQSKKLYDLTLSNEIRWMRKSEDFESLNALWINKADALEKERDRLKEMYEKARQACDRLKAENIELHEKDRTRESEWSGELHRRETLWDEERDELKKEIAELKATGLEHPREKEITRLLALVREQGENIAELKGQVEVAEAARDNIKAEDVRRIRHINRVATWAQQDPTGPLNTHQGMQVREWVLNELKAALGSEYEEKLRFCPTTHEFEKLIAERDRLKAEVEKMKAEDGGLVDEFLHRLLGEVTKLGVDMSDCDGDDPPEIVVARWFTDRIKDVDAELTSAAKAATHYAQERDQLLAAMDRAYTEIGKATQRQWDGQTALNISIPARPDHDSDLIIANALREARNLLATQAKEIAELKARCAAINGQRNVMANSVNGQLWQDYWKADKRMGELIAGDYDHELASNFMLRVEHDAMKAELKAEVEAAREWYNLGRLAVEIANGRAIAADAKALDDNPVNCMSFLKAEVARLRLLLQQIFEDETARMDGKLWDRLRAARKEQPE